MQRRGHGVGLNPASSRALLQPGPQPPLSHFGATLLRHVVTTGLRYALHSLGAPIPQGAPTRIVRLRLYLDRDKLTGALSGAAAAEQLVGALLEPGGGGALGRGAGATRGALVFHRVRLRLWRRRSSVTPRSPRSGDAPELWRHFRATLAGLLPALNDALLAELVASLTRRAERARGASPAPCLGREAHALCVEGDADLACLGVADPLVPAWNETPSAPEQLLDRVAQLPSSEPHPLRGGFREAYRRALNPLRSAYLRLAESARDKGLIEAPGDAFFIPFDLAEDLTGDSPAGWLPQTIATNRLEYQGLLEAGSPAETVGPGPPAQLVDDRADWALAPLWPLE